jgi:hypothetical protein
MADVDIILKETANKSLLSKPYQTLSIIISSGRSKEFLGRNVSLKDLESMTGDEIEAFFKIYELNYADKINNSLINGMLGIYSKVLNRVLPIDNVEQLKEDLNDDYILTSELKNITGSIAATCEKINVTLFSKHYHFKTY